MIPPLAYSSLKRNVKDKKDSRIIYLLYEGKNTEPLFIEPFIMNSNYFNSNRSISFRKMKKTESDIGVTNLPQLVELAKGFKSKNKSFRKGHDKIIIFFDLDVYKNEQVGINELLSLKDNDIIYCYTNPSIELFLLLTIKRSYELTIEPDKQKIIDNDFVNGKRYINYLFYEKTGIDSKSAKGEVSSLSNNFETAILQEKIYINHFLDKAGGELTSNIGYVFEKIKNNDFAINYLSE